LNFYVRTALNPQQTLGDSAAWPVRSDLPVVPTTLVQQVRENMFLDCS
jgi:hypothetical protein